MFEYSKFSQLDGLRSEKAQQIIIAAKKKAHKSTSLWVCRLLLFVFAIGVATFLMQLPRLLDIDQNIFGMLIKGFGILIAVGLYDHVEKKLFLKYLLAEINKYDE